MPKSACGTKFGWRVEAYVAHQCEAGIPEVPKHGRGQPAQKKGSKGKGKKAKTVPKGKKGKKKELFAYTGAQLARAVHSTVNAAGRYQDTSLKEVRKVFIEKEGDGDGDVRC